MLMTHTEVSPAFQKFSGDDIIGILLRLVEVTQIDLVLLLKGFESSLIFDVILGRDEAERTFVGSSFAFAIHSD